MGLYTNVDKQLDNYYEITTINKKLSYQNHYLKLIVFLLLICYLFMVIKCFI